MTLNKRFRYGGGSTSVQNEATASSSANPNAAESQQGEPDAERRLMYKHDVINPAVACDADRIADSSQIWIDGAFMRLSVQHQNTKLWPSAMPFISTWHLRTILG